MSDRSPGLASPLEVVQRFHAALAAGRHGEDLRHFFTEDVTTVEHPNALSATGATRGLEEMLAGSSAGARLLHWQRFEDERAVQHGEQVVLRVTWVGKVREAGGPFLADQVLRAHIAQFFEVRDGRICRIETYDCYEPFS